MLSSKNIKTIYHMADIHIRPLKRHIEYRNIFKKLYNEIKNDSEESLIIICGDIVHEKDKITPELIILMQEFLTNLSDITDVILFSGNHDLIENNLKRIPNLEALTPNSPNIHYLKKTGVYKYGNISFYLKSLEDNKPLPLIFNNDTINIGLYHGMLQEIGHSSGEYSANDFKKFDLTLLGDVHERQFLTDTIAYPGSLIQQNFGEDYRNHGFIKWDIKDKKTISYTTHNIHNEYGFVNIEIVDNKANIPENMPIYSNIKYKMTNSDNIDNIKTEISNKTNVQSEVVIHFNNCKSKVEYDEDFCKNIDDREIIKNELKQGDIDEILNLDKDIKNECDFKQDQDVSKYRWSIKSLEFMNLFIYGGNIKNKILFEEKDGVIGILGNNAIGKSTIFNIILFALYDKISSEYNIANVLNKDSKKMFIKLEFTIGNILYTLEKFGSIQKTKNGMSSKYTTNLFKTDHIDTMLIMNGKDKIKTQQIINELLGDRDTFILCNMVSNSLSTSLLTMSNSEILKSLSSLLYLDKYEDLYKNVSQKLKDTTKEYNTNYGKLSIYKDFNDNQLDLIEKTINNLNNKLYHIEGEIDLYKSKILDINDIDIYQELINKKRKEIMYINDNIELYNIDELLDKYESLKNIDKIEDSKLTHEYIDSLYKNIIKIENKVHEIGIESKLITIDKNIECNLTLSQSNTLIYELYNRINENKDKLTKYDNKQTKSIRKIYQSLTYDELIYERNKLQIIELENKKEIKTFYKKTLTGLKETVKINESIVYNNSCTISKRAINLKQELNEVKNYQLTENLYGNLYSFLDSIKSVSELEKYNKDIISTRTKIDTLEEIEKINSENIKWNTQIDKQKRLNDKNEKEIEKIDNAIVNCLIKSISKDIQQMNNYIWNYNNKQQLNSDNNDRLNQEIININNYKNKLELDKEIKIYNVKKEQIKTNNAIKKRNSEIKKEIDEYIDIIEIKNVSIINYRTIIHTLETKMQQYKTSLEYENKNFISFKDNMSQKIELENIQTILSHKIILYGEYKRLTDKKCLPSILLQEKMKFIEEDVNNYLTDMVNYTIKMYIDDKSKFIIDIHKNGNILKPYMCSGYESFILNIILKQSLNKYCYNTKSNIFCIDEGLDCIDDTNLCKFETLIKRLNQNYDNIILISQIDRIRKFINSEVMISNNGKYSIIS